MISIYVFYSELGKQFPQYLSVMKSLMQEQLIWGEDKYGLNESNSGGLAIQLPVYKEVSVNSGTSRICSSNQNGEQNKLGNAQFVKLGIAQDGVYSIHISKSADTKFATRPEFFIYFKGAQISYAENLNKDTVSGEVTLFRGNYILEIYDKNYRDNENVGIKSTSCFDVLALTK
jgi:hypothetical protein